MRESSPRGHGGHGGRTEGRKLRTRRGGAETRRKTRREESFELTTGARRTRRTHGGKGASNSSRGHGDAEGRKLRTHHGGTEDTEDARREGSFELIAGARRCGGKKASNSPRGHGGHGGRTEGRKASNSPRGHGGHGGRTEGRRLRTHHGGTEDMEDARREESFELIAGARRTRRTHGGKRASNSPRGHGDAEEARRKPEISYQPQGAMACGPVAVSRYRSTYSRRPSERTVTRPSWSVRRMAAPCCANRSTTSRLGCP